MTREQFWALVAQSLRDAEGVQGPRRGLLRRRAPLRPGERSVEALLRRLAGLSDDDLVAWQGHLDALRSDAFRVDVRGAGRVACRHLDEDAFTDLRTWLVSQGRAAYERVLADPDALVDVAPPDLGQRIADAELWGYVALEVWDSRHEDAMPRPSSLGAGEPVGEPFAEDDEQELRRRYPRLAARHL